MVKEEIDKNYKNSGGKENDEAVKNVNGRIRNIPGR